jgi:hypothetical protein
MDWQTASCQRILWSAVCRRIMNQSIQNLYDRAGLAGACRQAALIGAGNFLGWSQ